MINLKIEGRVIAKKNSRNIGVNRHTGRIFNRPSNAFNDFKEDALWQLKNIPYIEPPYRINYRFEMRGKAGTDVDNMMASINDILQDAGIIEDDKMVMCGDFKKVPDCKNYLTFLTICQEKEDKT